MSPQKTAHRPARAADPTTGHGRWPLLGVVAGVGGLVATVVLDVHPALASGASYTAAVVDDVSQGKAHAGIVVGYVVVALMLVLAAAWRRHVEPRALASTAARVVPLGLTASAGALSLGYGWRGALGLYHPDGNEAGAFDQAGLYVLFLLNDFGAYIGYLGVVVAAAAVAWMAFRERLVSRWIGVVSVLPIVPVVLTVGAFGLPGFPGVVSGLWMAIAFAGLALGRSPINR